MGFVLMGDLLDAGSTRKYFTGNTHLDEFISDSEVINVAGFNPFTFSHIENLKQVVFKGFPFSLSSYICLCV